MTIFEAVILLFKKSCAKTTLSFSFWKNFKKNQPTGHDHIHIVGWKNKYNNQGQSPEHV